MSERIVRSVAKHPVKYIFYLFIFLFLLTLITLKLPIIAAEIIGFSLIGFMFVLTIILIKKEEDEERKKKQNSIIEEYRKKWAQYFILVNQVISERKYNRDKLNSDWIQEFDQLLNIIASNEYLLKRKFNDFDIAACLVYSLTKYDDADDDILLAFECAKIIINEPKEYSCNFGYGYKLELEIEDTFTKVDITIPDKNITAKALTEIIRAYLCQKTTVGIIQLSDFLHILYLNCK